MGDLVNLRRAQKRKARENAETAASVNRSLHGVPKPERRPQKQRRPRKNAIWTARRLDPNTTD